jgi:hypothetical protein
LPTDQPLALSASQSEARKLMPHDAPPLAAQREGNDQWVVERFTRPPGAKALPDAAGQPGDFLVVHVKDAQGRIVRILVGAGDDPNALIAQAGQ